MSKKSQNFYTIGIYLNNQLSVSIMKANELAFAGKVFPTYMENLKDILKKKLSKKTHKYPYAYTMKAIIPINTH